MDYSKQKFPFSIQKMIKENLNVQHITPTQLARRLGMNPISVHQMLDRPGMQVKRLWSICTALNLNIFQALANEIGIDHYIPKVEEQNAEINHLKAEMEELKKEIELLENENKTLKEVITLLKP